MSVHSSKSFFLHCQQSNDKLKLVKDVAEGLKYARYFVSACTMYARV